MLKIVTAQEMSRIEAMAYKEGASELQFMEQAAEVVAEGVADFIALHDLDQTVTLLVGKGNNASDAYAAGAQLLAQGFNVIAWSVYSMATHGPLCQQMCERFKKAGGEIHVVKENAPIHFQGVIVDGLVGTGFHGKADGMMALAIQQANASGLPILAIDIPSGLNGNTGRVETCAIHATQTIFLELPKLGFFLHEGWDHVGELVQGTFGLGHQYQQMAKASAYLFRSENIAKLLPAIKRSRHKYEAGYVIACAGSRSMPGAAILSSFAALRSGAGMVRLFHPENMATELSHAPYELIKEEWDGKNCKRIDSELQRATAMIIGPGMGRTKDVERTIKRLIDHCDLPCVLDADALYVLANNPKWKCPATCILTPHRGEMKKLLGKEVSLEYVQAYAEHKKVTIVLKGAPTIVIHPHVPPVIVTRGDPGMATAGSGDVLTGVIAGLLAQGLDPHKAAYLGAGIHGIAGEIAASELTSYCMTASDILECLPDVFSSFLAQ